MDERVQLHQWLEEFRNGSGWKSSTTEMVEIVQLQQWLEEFNDSSG